MMEATCEDNKKSCEQWCCPHSCLSNFMKQKYLESMPREPDAGMQRSGTWLACDDFRKSLLLTVHKARQKR